MNNELLDELNGIARTMVHPGKGILAADESTGTIKKRFDSIGLESTEDNRRDYRELLFRTEDAMSENISGVILYDETIRQKAADGTPLVKLIEQAGSVPGIKVDMGAKDLAFHPGEKVTEGLTGLRERLAEYHQLGARFAKWRAVIDISRGGDRTMPSYSCLTANMHALARYAALCQEQRIVPIVEPEVLMDGDHDIDRCYEVTEQGLKILYTALFEARVALEGTILKPNMVIAGKKSDKQASTDEIAEKTVRCFRNSVPAAVPGIVFLSGGQSEREATENLNTMNRDFADQMPWALSFSYGRALQASTLDTWKGDKGNAEAAQRAFAHRAKMNGLAQKGAWTEAMEDEA
ncbi:class I fructose-bisphosphate aldolase [Parvularcula maris]|uniref:Fructose-bisphosphate aldolase n=1 Tax=Parvularcula maris TaxID=2965077 RepID=A0A9X2L897_9PROT|nr:class I fructose-bisphosphate aldolase [Parvularcula maris]MCQ8184764.1 fructose-bisphosphate aldolase class I [Parvularcula maris]